MSQANWSEYLQSRPVTSPPRQRPSRNVTAPAWLTDWESWLTFAVVLLVFLSVASSIESADWVPGMPSLTAISFIAICAGLMLARVRAPEVVLHLLALLLGAAVIVWLTIQFIDAPTFREGLRQFGSRWKDWVGVVRRNEPTTDNMPFVMLLLVLCWVAAYLSAWSIFRWRNAWLALIPGGVALLTNISYLPSQFSAQFVVFLFGSMLLVMRVHMLRKLHEWRRTNTPYPDYLSLNLLNVTTWVALGALILAWMAPQGNQIGLFSELWERVSAPFTTESDHFTRLFSSVDSKREVPLHGFGETLPLQGRVTLGGKIAAQVEFGEGTNRGRPLRAKVYDEYTPAGWKAGPRSEVELAPLEQPPITGGQRAQYKDRQEVTANFVAEGGFPRNVLPTIGQPFQVSVNSRAEVVTADATTDIDVFRGRVKPKLGDAFVTVGTISVAAEDKLRTAGDAYPQYVKDRYLQLPATLPPRVRQLAEQVTGQSANPYDRAKAVEAYLRLLAPTYDIRAVPPGRDAVDFFLFEEKKGYADYQASAMVVMLRAVGVPARLAVGYTVGEEQFDTSVRRYLLRDKNAYSWPEVFFPTYGWVEFSPYGDAPVISRPTTDNTKGDTAAGPDDLAPDTPIPDFGEFDDVSAGSSLPAASSRGAWLTALLPFLYALIALVALLGIAGVALRVAWERGMTGLDYPSQLWEKTLRLAGWLRLGPKPHETPTEYSRTLRRAFPTATAGVEVVADSYLRSRYGRHDLTPNERERLDDAWPGLRNGLIKRVLRWKS